MAAGVVRVLARELGLEPPEQPRLLGYDWEAGEASDARRQFLARLDWGVAAILEIHGYPWSEKRPIALLGVPEGEWDGPGSLRYSLTAPLAMFPLPLEPDSIDPLEAALAAAAQERLASLRQCQFCKRLIPPEHRLDARCCYVCGSEQFGIVY